MITAADLWQMIKNPSVSGEDAYLDFFSDDCAIVDGELDLEALADLINEKLDEGE